MANAGAPQKESKNIMCVDYANNPALKTLFARKEIGQACSLTVELTVMNKTPDQCTLAIKKIIAEDYEEAKDIVPDNDEPVMVTMRRKGTKTDVSIPSKQGTAQPTENSQGFQSYA